MHVKGYTSREVKRAKEAQRLYHSLTAQEIGELKSFIRQNMMKNNPVTTKDVNLVEAIFGKDVPTLKGKTANKKGEVVKDERIELPEELELSSKELELAIDILYVDKAKFLVGA